LQTSILRTVADIKVGKKKDKKKRQREREDPNSECSCHANPMKVFSLYTSVTNSIIKLASKSIPGIAVHRKFVVPGPLGEKEDKGNYSNTGYARDFSGHPYSQNSKNK
jgi:hypothetical protein